ncbi:asparagine synthase-related protein [Salinigranum halophilum]|uniref:asparagine synthase-related protein n=1 Tax=Salinigranum halophilum TaxID=2565931 RepID=UPI0010A8B6DA|nr:asparagine synthase-related protein [Salinigranum halophilum]
MMVGICGVLGKRGSPANRLVDDLRWTGHENTHSYGGGHVSIANVSHPRQPAQPARTADGVLVWVYGNVWSCTFPDGTCFRRRPGETAAAFCARQYTDRGIDFVTDLNGSFAAVIYDPNAERVYLLTDRLGTRPLYYARPTSQTVVFSTSIQSLPMYPGVDAAFHTAAVAEYLTTGSVRGIKTPFVGVEAFPPSSVTTVELDAGMTRSRRYWQPRFDPTDRPFSYFVDEFVDRFQAALRDRLGPGVRYGLLLSGGSDSRAILAALDDDVDVCTYHVTGWRSRETRTTERVAAVAGRPYELLCRDGDTHERLLTLAPKMMNFQGRFSEAHVHEFGDRLRDEVDVLISGLGADTLFRDHAFDVPNINVPGVGQVELPLARGAETVEDFIAHMGADRPAYLDTNQTLSEMLRENVSTDEDGSLTSHGIDCQSVDELVFFDDWYPFWNKSDFFFHALNGLLPHWTPFLDNRLVDLALCLPLKHRARRNVVNAATAKLDRRLAAIPHGTTGVPLTQSFPVEFVWRHVNRFRWKFFPYEDAPEPYLSHGPWVNTDRFVRAHDLVPETLRRRAGLIDALPFLDRDGAWQCYRDHLDGTNNGFELYTLLSFLEMPVVNQMARREAADYDDRAVLSQQPQHDESGVL